MNFVKDEEPTIDILDLETETRQRIPDLDHLLDLKTRMKVDRLRGAELE